MKLRVTRQPVPATGRGTSAPSAGARGDAAEREADQVAEQVMRMPAARRPARRGERPALLRSAWARPLERLDAVALPPTVRDALGTSGEPLSLAARRFFEPRFGHDFSGVRVHADAGAAAAAQAVQAKAFTVGRDTVFGRGQYAPDTASGRRLLAHELTHVVQQSAAGAAAPTLQRYAFVAEKQIEKSEKDFTPEMTAMVSDSLVRNYTGVDEFKKHAGKQTDYLGNLADGRWVRFEPTGINLLGEDHTKVSLDKVLPAVGSTSFIYEPFSADTLTAGSNIKAAYEAENKDRFKTFGVDTVKDKQPFGEESLFPKMGFALTSAEQYFAGKAKMSDLDPDGYLGQPVQRYLKIAWAFSKDNQAQVAAKQKAGQTVSAQTAALATVHAEVEPKIDAFITGLVVDGHLETELDKKANVGLKPPIAKFAKTFTQAMVELASTESSSRLSAAERKTLGAATSTSAADKMALFAKWRNFLFEDNVKAATKRGVRYAGMGQLHLDYLVGLGLDKTQHPFEMNGKDIKAFTALTDKLKKAAKKP
jgi:hypothetical protein